MENFMAKIVKNTRKFSAKGEELTCKMLEKLPDNCIVFYQNELKRLHNSKIQDDKAFYKPDFIVILPDSGILILEVKDWRAIILLKLVQLLLQQKE